VTPIDHATASLAIEAFDRYGKGRHPAALNRRLLRLCVRAHQLDAPLLCKGNDFPRTDISLG